MKTIRLLILAIVLVFLCLSCQRDQYYPVTKSDRGMIPYHIGDTVRFINDKGEQVTLVATKEISSWDCFEDYIHEEYRSILLEADSGDDYDLVITIQGFNMGSDDMRSLLFGVRVFGGVEVAYNSAGDFVTWDGPYGGHYATYDSVVIKNHIYYNVARGIWYEEGKAHLGYYNKTHGVLQMITGEKTVFTLDTVIFASTR